MIIICPLFIWKHFPSNIIHEKSRNVCMLAYWCGSIQSMSLHVLSPAYHIYDERDIAHTFPSQTTSWNWFIVVSANRVFTISTRLTADRQGEWQAISEIELRFSGLKYAVNDRSGESSTSHLFEQITSLTMPQGHSHGRAVILHTTRCIRKGVASIIDEKCKDIILGDVWRGPRTRLGRGAPVECPGVVLAEWTRREMWIL